MLIILIPSNQLINFQLPEKYRILNTTPTRKHKKKDKKHKYDNSVAQDLSTSEQVGGDTHGEKKHKKGKRHDDDKERKKRKKEKKRKKQSKHSPEHNPSETP